MARAGFPQNYVQRLPTQFPYDWHTTPANWDVTGGTKVGTNASFTRNAAASLEVLPTTANCVIQRASTFSAGVRPTTGDTVIGMWIYLQSNDGENNGPSNASINLSLANFNFTLISIAPFAGNHLRWNQWNYLCMHKTEAGATNAHGTGSTGWTLTGGGIFAAVAMLQIQLINMSGCRVYLDSVEYGLRSRPKIMFGFDAVGANLTDVALPMLAARGITGYITANMDAGGLTSSPALLQTWKAAGWEIVNHGTAHANVATMTTDAAIRAEIDDNWQMMGDADLIGDQEKIFFAPENALDPHAKRILSELDYKVARGYKNFNVMTTPFGPDNLLEIGSFDMGNPTSLARLTGLANAAHLYGGTTCFFAHDVNTTTPATGPTGSINTIYIDDLTAFADKLVSLRRQGLVDLVKPTEWYRGLSGRRVSA